MTTDIAKIESEVTAQIANKEVMDTLIRTTFKGLQPMAVKSAIVEGMMRGFTFRDFLEKSVYAIPFASGYSLITSIDYARKIGMKSNICGKSAPSYTMNGEKIESCTVTVKRLVEGVVGEYTATVFFDEYSTGKQQWASKPRTMIAKVAEMHALRMACPEAMAQMYTEDEMEKESVIQIADTPVISDEIKAKVANAKTEEELKAIWEEHKGLGKEFGRMVVEQKKFIKETVVID